MNEQINDDNSFDSFSVCTNTTLIPPPIQIGVVEAYEQLTKHRLPLFEDDDVLRPLLCKWYANWAERPPNVMKRSQR